MYVRSHLDACSAGSNPLVGTMATQRLPLLCRATYRMSPDVHRLVREYLTVRVGKKSAYIDDLLWWQMQHKGVSLNFCISGRIPSCIRKKKAMPDMGADLDAVEPEEDELIEVEIKARAPKRCSWYVDRWQMGVYGAKFTELLVTLREELDGRVPGRGAHMQAAMEAPSTEEEWRSFVQLWVFGPPKPVQGTLDRWLRPRA